MLLSWCRQVPLHVGSIYFCSRFCHIGKTLMRKPNSSTIRAFGRMMVVAVHVSPGVILGKFLFWRLGWYVAPSALKSRQQTLSLHDMLRDMAAGEHLLLMGNQGVGSLAAMGSCVLYASSNKRKELLALWIDPGIAIAKGVLTAVRSFWWMFITRQPRQK